MPRQMRKASAACSTSMPSPSRGVPPFSRAQAMKPCAARAVHHVAGQRAGLQHRARHRHTRARHAGGRSVDQHRVRAAHRIQRARREFDVAALRQTGVASHQLARLAFRAVGQHDAARPGLDQRAQHARRRATRAQQQHVAASQVHAGVAADVAHQADAIGVVREHAVVPEAQDVAGAGQLRARRQLRGHLGGLELERHGDVAALAAFGAERTHRIGKPVQRNQAFAIGEVLARQLGEPGMDPGRFAVFDGVAHHTVQVGSVHRLVSWVSSEPSEWKRKFMRKARRL